MKISLLEAIQPHSLKYTIFNTPLGKTGVAITPSGICRVMLSVANESEFLQILKSLHPSPQNKTHKLIAIEKEFHLYFNKKLKTFSFKPDYLQGTHFQRCVWDKLTSIPYGNTKSYQWLASAIGRPKSTRAVGNANGNNPTPLITPCHRIIRKDGTLGGFTGGTHLKQYLLDLEK